jgi:hypothetical protein
MRDQVHSVVPGINYVSDRSKNGITLPTCVITFPFSAPFDRLSVPEERQSSERVCRVERIHPIATGHDEAREFDARKVRLTIEQVFVKALQLVGTRLVFKICSVVFSRSPILFLVSPLFLHL